MISTYDLSYLSYVRAESPKFSGQDLGVTLEIHPEFNHFSAINLLPLTWNMVMISSAVSLFPILPLHYILLPAVRIILLWFKSVMSPL